MVYLYYHCAVCLFVVQYCNGDASEYQLDNGTWTSNYKDNDGLLRTSIDIFLKECL